MADLAPPEGMGQTYIYRKPNKNVTLINAVVLDDDPTNTTSSSVDVQDYSKFMLLIDVAVTASPTDVVFQVEVSLDGTNWYSYENGIFGDLRYEDGAGTKAEAVSGELFARYFRVKATATGTDGTNKFTVSVRAIFCD